MKSAAGVKVYVPLLFKTKTPCATGTLVMAVKVKTDPSVSLSFVATVLETATSSFVEIASLTAIGASFTPFTVIVKVAVSHKFDGSHVL